MSRITGSEVASLMEAYSSVYAPQELTEEQVWEEVENWVNSLLEEGYDLSEYTWEEMYEAYLTEMGQPGARSTGQNSSVFTLPKTPSAGSAGGSGSGGRRGSGSASSKSTFQNTGGYGRYGAPSSQVKTPTPAAATGNGSGDGGGRTGSGDGGGRRIPTAPKVAPTKPAPAGQTGDKAKDMATWAKANPKLAAAAAERARTRGTSSTTNPQMADMKSRLPAAAPKVAPSNTLSSTVAAASKPAAFNPAPEVKATNTIAASPKPAPVSPRQQRLNMEMEYDAYDLVLEYLLSEGHVETVEEAHYVMMEMDAETIGTIVEAAKDQSDKQIEKGVKTTYKAGNVLDNTHQGRSPGLNKLPRGEREGKVQRMRGRLKARRDDLFGERNKREDAAREEMKKKYGL